MKTSIKPKQCCKYTYSLFPKISIKEVLEINPWLFNNSFNFFAFYNDEKIIPQNVFELEKNWITEKYVLFSGLNNILDEYLNKINWDEFGTWYVFLYPFEIKDEKPVIIGRETYLDKSKGHDFEDYFGLSEEWQFIHKISPDFFITKQTKGVMIGALNDLNLWCVDAKKENSK
jgi:hypothetical protein